MKGAGMAQRIPSTSEIYEFAHTLPDHEFHNAVEDMYNMVRPQPWRYDAFQSLVGEYFIFEHVMSGGLTPAQAMAAADPELKAWSESKYVRVVADAPFDGDVALMRDVETGEVYEVHGDDITSHANWVEGSLGCRLCELDGVYRVVGWGSLHDNAEETTTYESEHASFVRDLNRIIGDGGWEDSVRSVNFG